MAPPRARVVACRDAGWGVGSVQGSYTQVNMWKGGVFDADAPLTAALQRQVIHVIETKSPTPPRPVGSVSTETLRVPIGPAVANDAVLLGGTIRAGTVSSVGFDIRGDERPDLWEHRYSATPASVAASAITDYSYIVDGVSQLSIGHLTYADGVLSQDAIKGIPHLDGRPLTRPLAIYAPSNGEEAMIRGGSQGDEIHGGTGSDTLTGRAGADTFWFGTVDQDDRITDFTAEDRIFVGYPVIAAGPISYGNGQRLGKGGVEVDASATRAIVRFGLDDAPGADAALRLDGDFRAAAFGWDVIYLRVVIPELFTERADRVDFKDLDPGQVKAVESGAGLYAALAGNDRIWLPNAAEIAEGKTFATSAASPFDAGAGADTVQGGSLADHVRAGDGNDILFGSPGADRLFGDAGADRFDFVGGDFPALKGFDDRTKQVLDGGVQPDGQRDILLLPRGVYSFSVERKEMFVDPETTIRKLDTDGSIVATWTTRGIEKAEIDDPFANRVSTASLYSAGVALADWSYADSGPAGRNWRPLSAMELGMRPGDRAVSYRLLDGRYEAVTPDTDTPWHAYNASVGLVTGKVAGERTLAVAFRGTDQFQDLSEYLPFDSHYANFRPLVKSLKAWIGEQDVEQVLVTGHSLGAAMAQFLAQELKGVAVQGFTFASPGNAKKAGIAGDLVNFMHLRDPVQVADLTFNQIVGPVVSINRFDVDGRSLSHRLVTYQESLVRLQQLAKEEGPFFDHEFAAALRAGVAYDGLDVQIAPGSDRKDRIASDPGDHFVLGGAGDDTVVLGFDALVAETRRMIDGGTGEDELLLPYPRSNFRLPDELKGPLYLIGPGRDKLVGVLHNIEDVGFRFDDADRHHPADLLV